MWRKSLEDWISQTSLSGFNQLYIESLYEQYSIDPSSVEPKWASLFADIESGSMVSNSRYYDSLVTNEALASHLLIDTYRNYGHLIAKIDPLERSKRNQGVPFNLIDFNLHPDLQLNLQEPVAGQKKYLVSELFDKLRSLYTGSIGYDFAHVSDLSQRAWLIKHIENKQLNFSYADQIKTLNRLVKAEELEKVLAAKFPGAKRFSLEGTESFVTLLDKLFELAGDNNFRDLYLSMAHRGRLNTLVNHFCLPSGQLFEYFSGTKHLPGYVGDVKYHYGRDVRFTKTTDYYKRENKVTNNGPAYHLDAHLVYNPSHLEFAGAVCLGQARAKQAQHNAQLNDDAAEFRYSRGTDLVLPIVVHGDSAVSGQGIVQEMLNLSKTRGYSVGGAIHIVINNQIGFTTNRREDMRSSTYCSDIAKAVEAPVFHVNADDPLAVAQVAWLAFKYRQRFKSDVFIDLVGYRRLGHNEGDDPAVTQPVLYSQIRAKDHISTVYANWLQAQGVIEEGHLERLRRQVYLDFLNDQASVEIANLRYEQDLLEPQHSQDLANNADANAQAEAAKAAKAKPNKAKEAKATTELNPSQTVKPTSQPTKLPKSTLEQLKQRYAQLVQLPENFTPAPTAFKLYQARQAQLAERSPKLNWGDAELLAYATLLSQGVNVRLTGEDARRGTFFHRLSMLHDQATGAEYAPLLHTSFGEGKAEIYDSTLSEAGVLGFEYGYSLTAGNCLTLWEAQFGDFANGAQVIIDQYISGGEVKWALASGLTLLLPHGYEGQGPEHSSARIERFLQLAAQDNLAVIQPTSAAQLYHALVSQGHAASVGYRGQDGANSEGIFNNQRKPLVIFTPKSQLRSPNTQSSMRDLVKGQWEPLLYDQAALEAKVELAGENSHEPTSRKAAKSAEKSTQTKAKSTAKSAAKTASLTVKAQAVTKLVLSSGKVRFDVAQALAGAQDQVAAGIFSASLEQLYPFPTQQLQELVAQLPNLQVLEWTQDEPQNQGAYPYVLPQLLKLAGENNLAVAYNGRAACATTASGFADVHKAQQTAIVSRVTTDNPVEFDFRK